MGARADYATALAAAVTAAGETLTAIVEQPTEKVPGTPSVVIYPGAPYLEPSGPGNYTLRLDAVLWAGRLSAASAMDVLDRFIPLMREAAAEAELVWLGVDVGIESLAGVEYITARNALRGETRNP